MATLKMKICSCCGESKELFEFNRRKTGKNGINATCKKCQNEEIKKWRQANPERTRNASNKYYLTHAEEIKEDKRKRYAADPEKENARCSKYKKDHPERIKMWEKKRYSQRQENPKWKLSHNVSNVMRRSLKEGKCNQHWERLVDFTIDQLRKHLEKLFQPGMTWENYGTYWSIDHKIPMAVFNYGTPHDIDFKLCWSLKNLQPLEAVENSRKRDKIDKPFQPSLMIAIN